MLNQVIQIVVICLMFEVYIKFLGGKFDILVLGIILVLSQGFMYAFEYVEPMLTGEMTAADK